jgi:hypothetical protein
VKEEAISNVKTVPEMNSALKSHVGMDFKELSDLTSDQFSIENGVM